MCTFSSAALRYKSWGIERMSYGLLYSFHIKVYLRLFVVSVTIRFLRWPFPSVNDSCTDKSTSAMQRRFIRPFLAKLKLCRPFQPEIFYLIGSAGQSIHRFGLLNGCQISLNTHKPINRYFPFQFLLLHQLLKQSNFQFL